MRSLIFLSQHTIPLDALSRCLNQSVTAKIALLGIKPKYIDFQAGLSKEAEEAVKKVGELLLKLLKRDGLTS